MPMSLRSKNDKAKITFHRVSNKRYVYSNELIQIRKINFCSGWPKRACVVYDTSIFVFQMNLNSISIFWDWIATTEGIWGGKLRKLLLFFTLHNMLLTLMVNIMIDKSNGKGIIIFLEKDLWQWMNLKKGASKLGIADSGHFYIC